MPLWSIYVFGLLGVLALSMVSIGVAMAVDPGIFAPIITDPKALKRRRIFGTSSFFLLAALAGLTAYFSAELMSYLSDAGLSQYGSMC